MSSSSESDIVEIKPKPKTDNYGEIVLSFGKHKGQSLDRVAKENPTYLTWLYKKMDEDKKKEPTKKLSPTMMAIRSFIKHSNLAK